MSCYRITTSVFIYCFLSIVVHQALAQDRSSVVQFAAVTAAELVDPVDEDWLIWRRTYDAQGYSPLDQVNKNNIKDLKEAWRIPLLEGPNMATPLVHDGVMFWRVLKILFLLLMLLVVSNYGNTSIDQLGL